MSGFGGVEQEHVAREGWLLFPVPERDLGLADALGISDQALAIEIGQGTGNDEFMRHAGGLEAAAPEVAQLDRVIDDLVVVGGFVEALAGGIHLDSGQRGGHPPAARQGA
jgi:hypothetical protein